MLKLRVMKHILLVVMMMISLASNAQNQNKCQQQNCCKGNVCTLEMQMRYLVRTLYIADKDTVKFMNIYRNYTEDMNKARNKYAFKNCKPSIELTDAELEERANKKFALGREILNVREKYYKQFRAILSPRQLEKIFSDEKNKKCSIETPVNKNKPKCGNNNKKK